jgi:hypothetical protein
MLVPTSLELDLSKDVTTSGHRVGGYDIVLELRRLKPGDNGEVEIRVINEGELVSTLSSHFNYDTLQSQHPLTTRWAWRDGDLWPDLVLELSARTCWIGSRDGKVHE